jgi:hypothetical protein
MRHIMTIALLAVAAAAGADEGAQYKFSLSVQVSDSAPVYLNVAVPPDTKHTLQATEHLRVQIEAGPLEGGEGTTVLTLLDDSTELTKEIRRAPLSFERSYIYTVCNNRVIPQRADRSRGSCGDLPALASLDPTAGKCYGDCYGPYEGLPMKLSSRARIAQEGEPGEPMVLTGRTLGADGQPRAGVMVYAYHTNAGGIYPPPDVPRSTFSNHHGKLRGWAVTDARGRYTFETIRPGGYPNGGEPQHVHMHVVERGCATYLIDELVFTDDPRLTPETRKLVVHGLGGSGVVTPRKEGRVWKVERAIQLGERIEGYPACGRDVK